MHLRHRGPAVTFAAVLAALLGPIFAGSAFAAPVSYSHQIAPLFATACVGCHGGASPASGLSVVTYAALMKGGSKGVSVVPGHSGTSRLVNYLTGALKPQMPVGGALKPAEIAMVRRWIDEGAKSDGGVAPARAAARNMPRVARAAPITALAYSPDGKTLAVGTYQQVQFRNPATAALMGTWGPFADTVRAIAYTKTGDWIAAGGGVSGSSGEIRLRDTVHGLEKSLPSEHTDAVTALSFSPDGKRLASSSMDKTIRIWDVAAGKSLFVLKEHADAVYGVTWSPNGKYIASCSADRSVKVWDPATGKRLYTIGDTAHSDLVYDVEFSPDSGSVVSAGGDHAMKLWAVHGDSGSIEHSITEPGPVLAAVYSPDGSLVAAGGSDHIVHICKTGNAQSAHDLAGARNWIYAVRFSPDGHHIAAGTFDGELLIWNADTGKPEAQASTLQSAISAPRSAHDPRAGSAGAPANL